MKWLLLICMLTLLASSNAANQGAPVKLTLVENAVNIGGVCLDGSLPGYHFDHSSSTGSDKWIVHLQGGAWCNDEASCAARSQTALGSSHFMNNTFFTGILSSSPIENSYFCTWNRVLVRYCDGGSFSGDVDCPTLTHTPGTSKSQQLFFRGQRIWKAVMSDLIAKGMASATQAILSGESAGGLAALIHCNHFRGLFPKETDVKCLSDGGMFLDIADIQGNFTFRSFFKDVVMLQNISNSLSKSCISSRDPGQCFFPEYFLEDIKPPTFFLQSAYDTYMIYTFLAPSSEDPSGRWTSCKLDPAKCSSDQLNILQGLRGHMLRALAPLDTLESWGLFLDSCFVHTQSDRDDIWNGPFRVCNTSMMKAVGLWASGTGAAKKFIDCPYPCNPTCTIVAGKEYARHIRSSLVTDNLYISYT